MDFETALVHAGAEHETVEPIASSICLSNTFCQDDAGGYVYGRRANPARGALERAVATLEGGTETISYASGCAAIFGLFLALDPGDHVIASDRGFFLTRRMLENTFARIGGVDVTFVDTQSPTAVRAALRERTRLVFVESIANPQLTVAPIWELSEVAAAGGALLVCDNTLATPVYLRPLELGASVTLASTAKYLAGHYDAMCGVTTWRERSAFTERVRQAQGDWGAIPSPFDCWLTLRGLKTLSVRVRQQSETALRILSVLGRNDQVARLAYPGWSTGDPGRPRPMGGLVSAVMRGGEPQARDVVRRVRLFQRATSFGGPESLIDHRAATEGAGSEVSPGLVRLSVGLESAEDLIADLQQAMAGEQ